eukprot:SAG11_NODE_2299_length_3552_cov_1.788300_3_plen_164_part_00
MSARWATRSGGSCNHERFEGLPFWDSGALQSSGNSASTFKLYKLPSISVVGLTTDDDAEPSATMYITMCQEYGLHPIGCGADIGGFDGFCQDTWMCMPQSWGCNPGLLGSLHTNRGWNNFFCFYDAAGLAHPSTTLWGLDAQGHGTGYDTNLDGFSPICGRAT